MKEHTRKTVNVLGIDVSVMRPEKAVNITMNYINRKEISRIYFHSAASSLFAQSHDWAGEWIDSCDLVFAGDRNMEEHLQSSASLEVGQNIGNGSFADSYIKRLFYRLNREAREIFVVTQSEDHLQSFKEYIHSTYSEIVVEGEVFSEINEAAAEKVVNEINARIPDIVFVCMASDYQIYLMHHYQTMMNTHLLIGIESLVPMIKTETENVPEWIQKIHLTRFYQWIKKEGKFQERVIRSLFHSSLQKDEQNAEESDVEDSNVEVSNVEVSNVEDSNVKES